MEFDIIVVGGGHAGIEACLAAANMNQKVCLLSLDIKNIGASNVCVTFLDKIVRKNTGSIRFGSNSSPISNSYYSFSNIENPYQVYKEIKEYMRNIQEKENQ